MRPGIGWNVSCTVGDCLTSRPKGRSWPRVLWFSISSRTCSVGVSIARYILPLLAYPLWQVHSKCISVGGLASYDPSLQGAWTLKQNWFQWCPSFFDEYGCYFKWLHIQVHNESQGLWIAMSKQYVVLSTTPLTMCAYIRTSAYTDTPANVSYIHSHCIHSVQWGQAHVRTGYWKSKIPLPMASKHNNK